MTENHPTQPRVIGHVYGPTLSIAGLSLLLVSGFHVLGLLDQLNLRISDLLGGDSSGKYPNHLPSWSIGLATGLFTWLLPWVILMTRSTWRRVVLWVSSIVVVSAWAPALVLAAYEPVVSGVWIATVWSGVCAIVYAGSHHMPCEPAVFEIDEED